MAKLGRSALLAGPLRQWLLVDRLTPLTSVRHATRVASTERLPSSAPAAANRVGDDDSEPLGPREICVTMRQVKTSPMKLNLVAKLIRRMSIMDALAQIKFCEKKASKFVEMTLLDGQRRAERTYDLDPLNLHIAESYVGKGTYLKRIRYHGRGQHGIMHKYYSHYFLKLREGPAPPKRKREKTDHKSFLTLKLIRAGPRSIPNSL